MNERDERLYMLARCTSDVDSALWLAKEGRSYLPSDLEGTAADQCLRDAISKLIECRQWLAVLPFKEFDK